MMTAVAQVNKWKRIIISQHDADKLAKENERAKFNLGHPKLEYMTKNERELWLKFFETLGQKKQLEEFLQTLKKPNESDKEELKAYDELVRSVYSKILSLLTTARAMRKLVEDIRRCLEEPEFRNNILPVTHRILQENTHARKMLKLAIIYRTIARQCVFSIFRTQGDL